MGNADQSGSQRDDSTKGQSIGRELQEFVSSNRYLLVIPLGFAIITVVLAFFLGSTAEGSFIYSLF